MLDPFDVQLVLHSASYSPSERDPSWFFEYLPPAFILLYLLFLFLSYFPATFLPSTSSSSKSQWLHFFDIFIQEEDILAVQPALPPTDAATESEGAPSDLRLKDPQLVLPALTLAEAVCWVAHSAAVLLQKKADNGDADWSTMGRLLWADLELRAAVMVTFSWVFAFISAAARQTRRPSPSLLVLFSLLLANTIVHISHQIHEYSNIPHPGWAVKELLQTLTRVPDLIATILLISNIMVTPFEAPNIKIPERTTRFAGVTRPPSPEDTNNMLGSLTYSWMDPLMSIARSRALAPSDVWALSLNNRAEVLSRRWRALTESTLLGKILHASARDILIDATLKLVAVTLSYARPYYLRRILECLTMAAKEASNAFYENDTPWSYREQAYVFAGLSVVVTAGRTLVEQRHYHHARRIGMRLRSEITVAVFEKALSRKDMSGRMTGQDDPEKEKTEGEETNASVGKVISLISDDTNRVLRMGCDSHLIYGAPLEIALALFSLYDLMGWSALVGFIILAISAPVNYWLGIRAADIAAAKSASRDTRQAAVTELVSAVQTIKFFGWSQAWIDKVQVLRGKELVWLLRENINRIWMTALWAFISLAVPLSAFFCFVKFQQQELTVAIAFTALALFGMVRGPLNRIPEWGIKILQTNVSIKRIDAFFKEDNVAPHATFEDRCEAGDVLAFENTTLQWQLSTTTMDHPWQLKDLDIEFPRGELTVVCGPTGSGKTALLLALLGELDVVSGKVKLPLSVSYASQHPWLESTSIRANILFGHPFNQKRYEATLDACALRPDLEVLPERDGTHVGERGVALSGGQKARIALARAIYAPTKTILLDDVLSAVDSHTAKHLYTQVLKGPLLRGRTCVLVTHHVNLVERGAAKLVLLEEGRVVSQGPPNTTNIASHESNTSSDSDGDETLVEADIPKSDPPPISSAERWTTGEVALSMYHTYLRAGTYLLWLVLVGLIVVRPILSFGEQYWLRLWGEASSSGQSVDVNLFLGGYAGITAASSVVILASTVVMFITSLKASRTIFTDLLVQVIHAPPRWFDVTPLGRITNRFTNDISKVDENLAGDFTNFVSNMVEMLVALAVTTVILPAAFIPVAAFALVYFFIFIRYLGVNRDVNRIAATSASPLFSGFQEALIGITTIRAFAKEREFRADLCAVVDSTLALWYCSATLDIWLSIRSQLLAACCLFATSFFAIYAGVSPGLAGIAITSSLSIIQSLDWLCSAYGRVVMGLNSLERITEYLELPQEPSDGATPPATWPSNASSSIIDVEDLCIRYSPELPEVLRKVNFSVKPGERVAIAGRTGSGKSTLAMSLLRFVDPSAGCIRIDGIDITKVDLEVLRQRVTFLPQDAILFSGTVRDNLDPLLQHTDGECLDALRRVHLHTRSAPTSGTATPIAPAQSEEVTGRRPRAIKLDTPVTGGGGNLSAGQRQLIALARALLRDSRIIIFDESTASIDFNLDKKIQETIRTEFSDACLITIAHRLRTIIDFDRVMCLEGGVIKEFDSPAALLAKDDSVFHRLCKESGDYQELLELARAKK